MRAPPDFPDWKTAAPPVTKHWLAAGALMALLAGGTTALLKGINNSSSVIFVLVLLAMALTGILWLCRLLYYRASVHHAETWQQAVERQHDLWWQRHRCLMSLREILLIGPAGSEHSDWLRVLSREQRPPQARQEAKGKTCRIARTFSTDITEREQQLARSLVLLWKKEQAEPIAEVAGVYWLGTLSAWQAFAAQMAETFPQLSLPAVPDFWRGEETLSQITAQLYADNIQQFLVAGCQSCAAASSQVLPAGESAVLWRVTAEGPVVLSRGEVFTASESPALNEVCARALQQSELESAPEACVLFSQPDVPELAESGWNVTHHLQDNYWGETGNMQSLIVISLAALQAQYQQSPCGWFATDPQHTLALGIVKPHGKG